MPTYLENLPDAAEGTREARFQQIYQTYGQLMYYVAFQRVGNAHDTEDVVQQAFVKIAENIGNIEPPCPKTKRFVVIVVENLCNNLYRYQDRRPSVSYEDAAEFYLAAEPEEENLLARCILKLPQQQRMVIWLKYVYGYSLREIAKIMDIPLGTAQKIDQRGKKQLEKIYREEGGTL